MFQSFSQQLELNKEKSQIFWRNQLSEIEPVNLDFLRLNDNTDSSHRKELSIQELCGIREIKFSFDQEILEKLNHLRKKYLFTPYIYGLSIHAFLLYRYTRQEKFGISYPIGIKEKVSFINGAHININIIPYDFSKINNILDIIEQTTQFFKSIKNQEVNHSYLPIYNIIQDSHSGILECVFAQTNLKATTFNFNDVKITIDNSSNVDLVNELAFEQEVNDKNINFKVKYKFKTINPLLLNNFVNCYQQLFIEILEELLEVNDKKYLTSINNYKLLSQEQYQQIVYEWNRTEKEYPRDKTIHQLFEEQVERTPDNIAVVYEQTKLTYKELNERANQLAHYLKQNYNIKPDTLVALCLDRSEHMLISILAVLKSGGAYVPMDPSYPNERIEYILGDTRTTVVVTNEIYEPRLKGLIRGEEEETGIVAIDSSQIQEQLLSQLSNNPEQIACNTNLAYIIYTSGTTGNPKGVMIEHKGVVNLAIMQGQEFGLVDAQEVKNCLWYANYVFDAHVSELYTAILNGHTLYVISNQLRNDIKLLDNYIKDNAIDIATIPPVLLDTEHLLKLNKLVVAGDKTDLKILEFYTENEVQVINAYGPTEVTVCATLNHYQYNGAANIGKPIANAKCYILDNNLTPFPTGVIGELYIGGVGIARGYLNRLELTEERFIANPFQTEEEKQDTSYGPRGKNARLYKTGDLVRWLPDGNIEYIGRNDFQVKIMGYRIELSEIEAALSAHPNIKNSIAIVKKSDTNISNKSLVAYYIPKYTNTRGMEWFPSVAEYYVYDDALYYAMTNHNKRNEHYRKAISKCVNNKIVVDIGTGPEAILSRICLEEGASKVYAIEYLYETYLKASQKIKELGLEDKITLIHGDSMKITLPEKVDVCVSEIVGAIGGSEGAIVIINDAKKRHVKEGGKFIPEQSLTKIAGVTLPADLLSYPLLCRTARNYVQKIFADVGYEFNLRLCIKNISYDELITTESFLEDLDWDNKVNYIDPNATHNIRLDIIKAEILHGFLVWLVLKTDKENTVDILSDQASWLPIYFPVFPEGLAVEKGDYIEATISRNLIENSLNTDYHVKGKLYTKKEIIDFSYTSTHFDQKTPENKFYSYFLKIYKNNENYNLDLLHSYLEKRLPAYMVPSTFVHLEKLPLTINGKLDRKALPDPEFTNSELYATPRNELEENICKIWAEVLGLSKDKIGIQDNFFRLGGNSINGIQLANRLNTTLNTDISISTIIQYSTINELAHHIKKHNSARKNINEEEYVF